jgi:hypothetical protein
MRQAISYRLFKKYGIIVSPQDLRSIFDNYILEDKIEQLIEEEKKWFEFFQSKVTFIDDIRNPYGIHLAIKNKCETDGDYTYSKIDWKENGIITTKTKRDKYIPHNPDKIQIIIIDHASLLLPEKGDNLYEAVGKLSSRYLLEARDLWKCQICLVQQQTPTSETQQYTMIGGTILDKVKPSANNLGYNKSTAQDANLMLSIFHPARYNQKHYNGIDLTKMNDTYRELTINFNRDGISNVSTNIYFNGAVNYFEEISDKEKIYNKIEKFKNKR